MLKKVLFAVGSTAIYLGLAIWGRGGIKAFFSVPALAAAAALTVVMAGFAPLSAGNVSSGVREDRANRWVLWVFFGVGLLEAFVPALADREDLWTIDGSLTRWIGVALFAAGGVLRLWPVFLLGNRFSGLVAIQPGHRLETRGIYGTIRHPSYLGMFINAAGWALVFRSLIGLGLVAVMIPAILARMNAEERLLASEFGEEYAAYKSRTWRMLPRIY